MNKKLLAVLNDLFLAGTIAVNFLSTTLPINGYTPGEISDMYPNLFVPAGITFSIWGVIYLMLIGFAVYQTVMAFKGKDDDFIERIGVFFIITSVLNMGWIFAWHYLQMVLSMIIMIGLLITLIMLYLQLEIGKDRPSVVKRLFYHVPFSIYLGWITVATVANMTALLVRAGWNGGPISETGWAVMMICAALIITELMLITRKDIAYSAVIVWAFAGIWINQKSFQPIVITVAVGIGMIIITAIIAKALMHKEKPTNKTA